MDLFQHARGLFCGSTLIFRILYLVIPCGQEGLHHSQWREYLPTIFKQWDAGRVILFVFILGRIQLSYMLFFLMVGPFMMFLLLLLHPFNFLLFI
jgi:hypothetical protein